MEAETFVKVALAIASLCSVMITGWVVPWLKSKIGEQEFAKLLAYIRVAVRCAEQIYTPEQWQEKKRYVMQYIKNLIGTTINVKLTDEQLDSVVEGIVNEVKKGSLAQPVVTITEVKNNG